MTHKLNLRRYSSLFFVFVLLGLHFLHFFLGYVHVMVVIYTSFFVKSLKIKENHVFYSFDSFTLNDSTIAQLAQPVVSRTGPGHTMCVCTSTSRAGRRGSLKMRLILSMHKSAKECALNLLWNNQHKPNPTNTGSDVHQHTVKPGEGERRKNNPRKSLPKRPVLLGISSGESRRR